MKSYTEFYIGNEWVNPSSTDKLSVINPFTEQVIATVPEGKEADIDLAVSTAKEAFDQVRVAVAGWIDSMPVLYSQH